MFLIPKRVLIMYCTPLCQKMALLLSYFLPFFAKNVFDPKKGFNDVLYLLLSYFFALFLPKMFLIPNRVLMMYCTLCRKNGPSVVIFFCPFFAKNVFGPKKGFNDVLYSVPKKWPFCCHILSFFAKMFLIPKRVLMMYCKIALNLTQVLT
jgi:hypothetical protein